MCMHTAHTVVQYGASVWPLHAWSSVAIFRTFVAGVDFFFFQAEDGIRDKLVTGVQTCALPISLPLLCFAGARRHPAPLRAGPKGSLRPPGRSLCGDLLGAPCLPLPTRVRTRAFRCPPIGGA